MNSSPGKAYIEIHVPDVGTEREFLQLAVQRAVKQYRQLHTPPSRPQAAVIEIPALPLHPGPATNAPQPSQRK